MEKIKVIFLDVDGVLNSDRTVRKTQGGYTFVDNRQMKNLKHIINMTGAMLLFRPTPGLDITFRKCAAFRRRWQLWHLTESLNVSLGDLSMSMLTSILLYINGTMPTRKRCALPCSTPAFSLSQKKRSVTV